MVNLIHQFQPGGAVVDKAALEQFQKQWATYQKLVDEDYLSHNEVGRLLHDTLDRTFAKPFAFVDIACGDASEMKGALAGVKVRHYHGIDLSEPALELAAKNLAGMPFKREFDHRDFVEVMNDRPEPADASWCSLSIHHLQPAEKIRLLDAIRRATSSFLMIYEPTRLDGEDRAAYLARFIHVNQPAWTALSADEWGQIEHHVVRCDFPETSAGWLDIGRKAGFAKAEQLFDDPTNFYRVYRFDV
jgi:hypothetical protein